MEAPEEDTEFLTLTQPVKGVTLRLSDTFYDQETPCTAEPGHLLAVSNQFGWVVAANSRGGFGLFSLPALRSTVESASPHDTPRVEPKLAVPTAALVDFLRFAMGDKLVLAGLRDGTVVVWRLKSLVEGKPEPLRTLPATAPGTALLDLCPNPAPDSPLVAVLSPAAPLTIYNLETASVHATFPADLGATSACWSVKGKQLAVGTASAAIVQLTPEGEQKAVVPRAANELAPLGGTFEVRSVEWLENNVFLATYARPRTASEDDVQHEDEVFAITKVGSEVQYTKFADPCPPFGMMGRQGRRWVGRFKNWDPFKHLLVMVNAPSADIGVLAQAASYSPTSTSNGWATLTLPEDTRPTMPTGDLGDDACPLALELDLSRPNGPAVLVYTSRGALVYWTFKNERATGRYEGMVESRDVFTQEGETASAPVETKPATAAAAASTPSAFGAFASPSASTPAAPAFGSTSIAPAFGAKPTFGTSAAPAFGGASAFGSSASKPAFGATSSPFGAASTPSAFGSASPSAAPAFGSTSSLGFGAFGSSSPSAKPAMTSPFATAAASTASTPAAGSAFAAVPSSGGFSAFGSGSTGGFGAAAGTSSTPKASPFGSGSAFGAAPAFGASASSTATTKPASPASGGFASFGAATGSSTSSAGGFGGFGGSGTKSVFGAPSTPGTSAFGSGGTAPASGASKFSFAPTASRGGRGSDDEDEDEDNMVDEAKERADEPPDLEPTKVGLDFAQSVREAEKAGPPKRENAPAATTSSAAGSDALSGGFGSLGFGGVKASGGDENKPATTTSVFGSAVASTTTPVAAPAAKPAFGFGSATTSPSPFGGSSFGFGASATKKDDSAASKPASAFGSGGFAGFAPASTTSKEAGDAKPTFSFAPKPAETPKEEAAPVAKSSDTAATPATTSAAESKPPTFSFAPPAQVVKQDEETKPAGSAFSFGGTATSGGFGAFATTDKPAATQEEQKGTESAGSEKVDSTAAQPASKEDEEGHEDDEPDVSQEQEQEDEEEEDDDEQEPSLEASEDGTESEASGGEQEPPAEPAAPSKPAFSFASSSTPAFPKPTASGGFGAFSSGGSSGFGFGAAASGKTPSSTGFGFGVATTPSPSAASSTGFSFAPKAAAPSDDKPATPKPAFSFAPQKPTEDSSKPADNSTDKPTFSFAPKPASEPVAIPAAAEKSEDSTKSLFGFASSPPGEKSRSGGGNSLLSRIGAKEAVSEDEQSVEDQDDVDEEDDEERDEERDEEGDEEGEDEENASDEDADQDGEQSENASEDEAVSTPSGQPSLLSRLSPAPASPSPAAPEAKPSVTPAPSFSFAPAKPSSPAPAAPSEPSPKPPTLSFAAPPASASGQSSPLASPALIATSNLGSTSPLGAPKSPGGFLNFTSTAPRASSPLSAPPLAAQTAPAAPKSTSPAAPSPGLFGAGAAKPALSFGSAPPATVATPKASPAPISPTPIAQVPEKSVSPAPAVAPPSQAPVAEAPKVPEPEAPEALSVVSKPVQKLGTQLIAAGAAAAPTVNEKGMAGEFLKAYLSVHQDFELLRKNSSIIKDFVDALGRPCHAPLTKGTKPSLDAKDWSFGDIDKLRQLTEDAAPGVETLHVAALAQKRRIAELQSQLLKAETKREEAARFLRARSDPAFAKLVRVRQLGPEQTENQRRIRLQVEAVRTKIEQLEEHLLSLKKQIAKEKLGQPALQAPSLDSIQRAMRNISVAAAEKSFELDELASKLDKLRVRNGSNPATPRKQQSFGMSPLKAALDQSSLLRQPSPASLNTTVSTPGPAAAEMAATALVQERVAGNLKKALLNLRTSAPLVNRSACGSQTAQLMRPAAADIQLAFAHGPITGERLPRPRHYTPPALPQMVAPTPIKPSEARQPPLLAPAATETLILSPAPSLNLDAPASEVVPPIFPSLDLKKAPSFSFASPVAATPPPSSTPQPGAGLSRGSASRNTSSRVHGGAVQLKSTGTPPNPAASTFDWGPLPSTLGSTSTPVKTGNFISLSATPSTPPPAPDAASAKPSFPLMGAGSSTPSATAPAKTSSGFSFANASTPATPPAASKALPSFSFAGGSTTPSATPSKPPASFSFATSTPAASPAPSTFAFSAARTDAATAKPGSVSFGTSTPTAKAPSSFSFGGTPSTTPATKPSLNFGGFAAAAPAAVSESSSTGEVTPKAAEDAGPAEETEERQNGDEGEDTWSGEGEDYGEEEYGESGEEEDEEGLEAISEHTEED